MFANLNSNSSGASAPRPQNLADQHLRDKDTTSDAPLLQFGSLPVSNTVNLPTSMSSPQVVLPSVSTPRVNVSHSSMAMAPTVMPYNAPNVPYYPPVYGGLSFAPMVNPSLLFPAGMPPPPTTNPSNMMRGIPGMPQHPHLPSSTGLLPPTPFVASTNTSATTSTPLMASSTAAPAPRPYLVPRERVVLSIIDPQSGAEVVPSLGKSSSQTDLSTSSTRTTTPTPNPPIVVREKKILSIFDPKDPTQDTIKDLQEAKRKVEHDSHPKEDEESISHRLRLVAEAKELAAKEEAAKEAAKEEAMREAMAKEAAIKKEEEERLIAATLQREKEQQQEEEERKREELRQKLASERHQLEERLRQLDITLSKPHLGQMPESTDGILEEGELPTNDSNVLEREEGEIQRRIPKPPSLVPIGRSIIYSKDTLLSFQSLCPSPPDDLPSYESISSELTTFDVNAAARHGATFRTRQQPGGGFTAVGGNNNMQRGNMRPSMTTNVKGTSYPPMQTMYHMRPGNQSTNAPFMMQRGGAVSGNAGRPSMQQQQQQQQMMYRGMRMPTNASNRQLTMAQIRKLPPGQQQQHMMRMMQQQQQQQYGGYGMDDSMMMMTPVEPLVLSDNRWIANSLSGAPTEGLDSDEIIFRKIKALLNKLTIDNFSKLSDQLLGMGVTNATVLRGVILLIFDKALDEPNFSSMYAQLCYKLSRHLPSLLDTDGASAVASGEVSGSVCATASGSVTPSTASTAAGSTLTPTGSQTQTSTTTPTATTSQADDSQQQATFRRLLINKCQEEFEKRKARSAADIEADRQRALSREKDREAGIKEAPAEDMDEAEYHRLKERRRMLGNIKFIGELFKLGMLTERIMHQCICQLLENRVSPDPDDIESLCKLLATVGMRLDHEKAKCHMDAYFQLLKEFTLHPQLPSRIRFMLLDVDDLRANAWKPRLETAALKSQQQVRHEAAIQHAAIAAAAVSQRRGQGGRQWNVPVAIPQQPRAAPKLDLASLGRVKQQASKLPQSTASQHHDNVVLGPSAQRAKSNQTTPMGSRTGSSTNLYAALQEMESGKESNAAGSRESSNPTGNSQPTAASPNPTLLPSPLDLTGVSSSSQEVTPAMTPRLPSPTLSAHAYEEKLSARLEDFFYSKNVEDMVAFARENVNLMYSRGFVVTVMNKALERKASERVACTSLLIDTVKEGIVSMESLGEGLDDMMENVQDIAIDVPQVYVFLGEMLAAFISAQLFTIRGVIDVSSHLTEEDHTAAKLLCETLNQVLLLTDGDEESLKEALKEVDVKIAFPSKHATEGDIHTYVSSNYPQLLLFL